MVLVHIHLLFFLCLITALITVTVDVSFKLFVWRQRIIFHYVALVDIWQKTTEKGFFKPKQISIFVI